LGAVGRRADSHKTESIQLWPCITSQIHATDQNATIGVTRSNEDDHGAKQFPSAAVQRCEP